MITRESFPPALAALIELACAIVICAGIVVMGYAVDRYTHSTVTGQHLRVPANGLWFCFAGQFGNGCWDGG